MRGRGRADEGWCAPEPVRILRLVTQHGAADLRLIDELTGHDVPDVRRVEFAPLEMNDRRFFATIIIH
jgi:hypothetical protein